MKSRLTLPFLVALTVAGYGLGVQGSVPDVPTGQWMPGPSLAQPREGAVSVALDDGRVLIIGGRTAAGPVATVEALNPDGTLAVLPSMAVGRVGHTAVRLADGNLLVSGGTTLVAADQGTVEAVTSAAEIFFAASNTWAAASPLNVARTGHTATALADGRVLVAGGTGEQGALDSMEVFEEGAFRAAGILSAPRSEAAAALASKTQVLVAGGRNADGILATADLVDVDSGAVAQLTLTTPRASASATTLLDGTVLIAGGNNGTDDLASAEVIDAVAGTSSNVGAMSQPRSGHQATLLDHNANVLIVGGTNAGALVTTAELFAPWTGQFIATNPPAAARTNAIVNSTSSEGVAVLAAGKAGTGAVVAPTELYGFATVKTDKDDYAPGTFVTITGSGWQPGETVNLVLHETGPAAEPDLPLIATADAAGRIFNDIFAPNEGDIGRRFYLTAVGAGATAQTTFSDALQTSIALVSSTNPSAFGQSVTFTATVTYAKTDGGHNAGDPVSVGTVRFGENGNPNCGSATFIPLQGPQTPNGSGEVTFTTSDLSADTHTIRACYDGTGGNDGTQGTSASLTQTVNAANASISGTVYNDANGNGSFDTGEIGISGVTVTRSGTGATPVVTNATGVYTFSGLAASTYSINYTVPTGFANTGTKPLSVTVAAGDASTGNNFFAAPEYTVTFQQSGVGNDTGSATVVTVNGTPYAAASMPTLTFTAGQSVTYAFSTQVTSTLTGKRYALTTPAPAPPTGFNVSGNTTLTGTYKTQYRLTLDTSPSGIGTVPNPSANPSSADGFYDSGANVTVTAQTQVPIDSTSQYRFDHWSGDASGSTQPAAVSMTAARAVTANYVTQYQVTFAQTGIQNDTTDVVLTVDATTFTKAQLQDIRYWDTGTTWTFGSPIATGSADKRYRLTSTATGTITSAGTITGAYIAQYRLTLNTSPSGVGGASNPSASSADGFYDDGTEVNVDALSLVDIDATSRYRFDQWSGDAAGTTQPVVVKMTAAKTVTAVYVTQYKLTLTTNPGGVGGAGNPSVFPSSSDDFYDSGDKVNVEAEALVTIDATSRYRFDHWSGGALGTTNPVEVTMNAAKTVTANYVTQYQATFAQTGIQNDTGTTVVLTVNSSTTFSKSQLPDTRYWDTGTTWSFDSPIATNSADKRYRLTSTASGTISTAGTITGNYVAQYRLTLNTSPSGVGGATNPSPDLASADGFYDDTTKVKITAAASVTIDTTSRYRFDHWTGDASGNTDPFEVTMSAPRTVTASYVKQFLITFAQSGITVADIGSYPWVKVEGTDRPNANPFAEWYDENAHVSYSFYTPISTVPVSDTPYELTNGATLPTSPISVIGPTTITGQYAVAIYSILYHQPIDQSVLGGALFTNTGKNGRVIPVKVDIFRNESPVQTGSVLMKVSTSTCLGIATTDPVTEYADAGSSNGNTNLFRWAPGFWIYNLDTGALGLKTNSCYRLDVYLNATSGSTAVLLSQQVFALFKPVK